ncbi:MAG TPA: YciI family protein, partial [Gemmatimonadales bacterium]|nr:YciI family protein [Gemmatimonadales bacterium]
MKYLCLIYMNEEERDAIPAEQWEPLMQEGFDWGDERREQGVFLDGNPLQPVRTAVTVRRKRGELSFTDGPFMETKEQLAGYTLIEAPDMEAAKEIAATLPPGRIGTVEI